MINQNLDSFAYIRDFKNPAIRNYYYRNVRSSYGHMIELSLFGYLKIVRNLKTNFIPSRILEIGYGYDAIGLELLLDYHKFDPRFIVGIESKQFIHEKVKKQFDSMVNLYKVDDSGEALCELLKKWVDAGVKFDFIYSRYLMDEITCHGEVIALCSQLLDSPKEQNRYTGNFHHGMYAQKTRNKKYREEENFNPLVTYLDPSIGTPPVWPDNSWQHLVSCNNLIVQKSGFFRVQTQLSGNEEFLIATKGIE